MSDVIGYFDTTVFNKRFVSQRESMRAQYCKCISLHIDIPDDIRKEYEEYKNIFSKIKSKMIYQKDNTKGNIITKFKGDVYKVVFSRDKKPDLIGLAAVYDFGESINKKLTKLIKTNEEK